MTSVEFAPPPEAVDIGGGHRISYVEYQGETAGINDYHLKADGTWCAGWVSFHGSAWEKQFPNDPGWTVVKREPLTLTPSILCRSCKDHGFITDGKWVKA